MKRRIIISLPAVAGLLLLLAAIVCELASCHYADDSGWHFQNPLKFNLYFFGGIVSAAGLVIVSLAWPGDGEAGAQIITMARWVTAISWVSSNVFVYHFFAGSGDGASRGIGMAVWLFAWLPVSSAAMAPAFALFSSMSRQRRRWKTTLVVAAPLALLVLGMAVSSELTDVAMFPITFVPVIAASFRVGSYAAEK
ncbi:MAG: hypothetical protein ABFD92_15625 [Planctomycetaceae bacterium]|nr:hypothetical protein [Planctomycetaceae bacterium]